MAIVQFRGLAQLGQQMDPEPYELGLTAWSGGSNMRFHANKAERAPAFKVQYDQLPFQPAFIAAYRPANNSDTPMLLDNVGTIYQAVQTAGVSNVTPTWNLFPTIVTPGNGYIETDPPSVTFTTAAGTVVATGITTVNAAGALQNIVVTALKSDPGTTPVVVTIAAPPAGATGPVQATGSATRAAWSLETDDKAYTADILGDCIYINRPSLLPAYYGPESTAFAPLPDWPASWSCRSLRGFADYMVALNVTKGPDLFPNMVKWSDVALAGTPPYSWDADDVTTSAGENILESIRTPLVDSCTLGSLLVLYTEDEVWLMSQTYDTEIFAFNRAFGDGGLIAPNCAVEVNRVNYCFGENDIYRHDGLSKSSIIDKLNRDYVYENMDLTRTEQNFVIYNPRFSEVMFCFTTTSPTAAFAPGMGCNIGAVYDLVSGTWAFRDLPNLTMGAVMNLVTGALIESLNTTPISALTGTIADMGGTFLEGAAFTSALQPGITANRVVIYDFANKGPIKNMPFPAELNPPATLTRTGIDLDTQGGDLATYKVVRRVFPLVHTEGSLPVTISVGSQLVQMGPVTWDTPISFDPAVDYKIDTRRGGRFLGISFTVADVADFEVVGFDADVVSAGRR